MNVLVGITGTVASTLVWKLKSKLEAQGHSVKIMATENALYFVDPGNDKEEEYSRIYRDKHEFFGFYSKENDAVLHIELRNWSDAMIMFATANTLAKMANGICDNLVTSVVRCWNYKEPMYIAPEMNTYMWRHPMTSKHLAAIKEYGAKVICPIKKKLACGDYGIGALAELDMIVNTVNGSRWRYPFLIPADGEPPSMEDNSDKLFVPKDFHLGAFGVKRHVHYHTGVDLYAPVGMEVFPFEEGTIIDMGQFTGGTESPWWNDTWFVSVKGQSGIIVYGEIMLDSWLRKDMAVDAKTRLGTVLQVCKKIPKFFVPKHRPSMLHVELLKGNSTCTTSPEWVIGGERPQELLDPTSYLDLIPGYKKRNYG